MRWEADIDDARLILRPIDFLIIVGPVRVFKLYFISELLHSCRYKGGIAFRAYFLTKRIWQKTGTSSRKVGEIPPTESEFNYPCRSAS